MLDKDIFKERIEKLMYVYPTWQMMYKEPKVMKTWYSHFEKLHDIQFKKMVDKYIETETKVPTVAGLLKCREEYTGSLSPEDMEKGKRGLEELLGGGDLIGE